MSFQQNPLIPTWNCSKGRERKRKCKEKVKDISRFLSERLIERRRSGGRSCSVHCTQQPCSFALMQKNQKIKLLPTFWLDPESSKEVKAYTPEATNSHRSAKISETRLRLKQPKFLYAPLGICLTPLTLGQFFHIIYGIEVSSW